MSRSLKFCDERLVIIMRPTFSFLGLVKLTRMHSSEGSIYMTRIWNPIQSCAKLKRYSLEIVGKNEDETRGDFRGECSPFGEIKGF